MFPSIADGNTTPPEQIKTAIAAIQMIRLFGRYLSVMHRRKDEQPRMWDMF